jgi:hypothetical protein
MSFAFNPLTGNFDLKGSGGGGGASYIDGEVATYTDLPLDGSAALNTAWLVREASGTWLIARKPAGIYIRTATAGVSRDADWTYAGILPDVFNDANFLLYDNADSSKNLAFQLSGISASTTRTLTVPDASGTIALTGQLTDTKVYTANDTWTKPAGAKLVHYIVIGGGGGGGSGRCDNAGTDRSGGGGGCAGGITVGWLDASALGATEAITVGAGGAGGAARTTAANGQLGTSGGVSSIGSVIQTFASVGGSGGTTTTGSGGTGANNSARIYSADGATNGGVNGSNAGRLQGSAVFNSPTGGQGGSGISAANVVSTSAAAADSGHVRTGALVAGGTGGASAAGGNGNSGGMNFVGTGGGGGSPNSSTGAGNAGGNGGLYGGGGGGGSAGALPAASGAGGNGAAGIVVITTYF